MTCMHDGTFDIISQFLGCWSSCWRRPRLGGYLAQRLGQPAVLGELIGGVLVGPVGARAGRSAVRDDPSALRAGGGDPAVRDRAGDRSGPAAEGGRDVAGRGRRGGGPCRSRWDSPPAGCWVLGPASSIMAGGDPDGDERGDHRPRALRPRAAARSGGPDHPRRRGDRRHPGAADPDVVEGTGRGHGGLARGRPDDRRSAVGFLLAATLVGTLVVPLLFRWAGGSSCRARYGLRLGDWPSGWPGWPIAAARR